MITSVTITSEDITALADKDTFSMTTKDRAQVKTQPGNVFIFGSIKVSEELLSEVLGLWHKY